MYAHEVHMLHMHQCSFSVSANLGLITKNYTGFGHTLDSKRYDKELTLQGASSFHPISSITSHTNILHVYIGSGKKVKEHPA